MCGTHRLVLWSSGKFVNGELYGRETDLAWGVIFLEVRTSTSQPDLKLF